MPVDRELPTHEAADLIALTRDLADAELAPQAAQYEREERFPREIFATLGEAGLLGLPFGEDVGGGGQPYAVYLQVVEELAARWASVALGVSVHTLSCNPIARFGTDAQRRDLLPDMVGGHSWAPTPCPRRTPAPTPRPCARPAEPSDDGWVARGEKAWVTHGGHADFYSTFLRTPADGPRGISCFHLTPDLPASAPPGPRRRWASPARRRRRSAWTTSRSRPTASSASAGAACRSRSAPSTPAGSASARSPSGSPSPPSTSPSGYAPEREAFGRPIVEHQGLAFLLADMAAAVESARATYLVAARRKDAGKPYSRQASIAKLVATDAAMKVTTDAVQVLGGAGYTREFPVERYMREAKVMQIFEGTNQIQRMVIGRTWPRRGSHAAG